MCTEATFQPIVFLVEPYSLRGSIHSGVSNRTEKDCSDAKSKVAFEIYSNVMPQGRAAYAQHSDSVCPREVLKFDPPAQNKQCNRNVFRHMTKINEFGLNFTFENVSFQFELTIACQCLVYGAFDTCIMCST